MGTNDASGRSVPRPLFAWKACRSILARCTRCATWYYRHRAQRNRQTFIGDNGAGKSTLIKVMTGVLPADPRAEIFVRDREIRTQRILGPHGSRFVDQDRLSRTSRSPESNRCGAISSSAGRSPNRFGFIDIKRQKEVARHILIDVIGFRKAVGISIQPWANLSGGERPGIAIGRAMHYNADLIVLDEPTAALRSGRGPKKVVDFVRQDQKAPAALASISNIISRMCMRSPTGSFVLDRGSSGPLRSIPKDMTVPGTHRISDRAAAPKREGGRGWLSDQACRSSSASKGASNHHRLCPAPSRFFMYAGSRRCFLAPYIYTTFLSTLPPLIASRHRPHVRYRRRRNRPFLSFGHRLFWLRLRGAVSGNTTSAG